MDATLFTSSLRLRLPLIATAFWYYRGYYIEFCYQEVGVVYQHGRSSIAECEAVKDQTPHQESSWDLGDLLSSLIVSDCTRLHIMSALSSINSANANWEDFNQQSLEESITCIDATEMVSLHY